MGRGRPSIVGILNLTADSFSDAGRFLDPAAARRHAEKLRAESADWIELGPASSHPDAVRVSDAEQIARLEPVLASLVDSGAAVAVDSPVPAVQRYAVEHGARLVNDIRGFPDPEHAAALAESGCRLVAMHSLSGGATARRMDTRPDAVIASIHHFFDARLEALCAAGVPRESLILDPGMGFFLGTTPEPSLAVLRHLPELRRAYGLPLLISVSRKSFLQQLSGRPAAGVGADTLAAELHAVDQGVDFVRTHDVGALCDALRVRDALAAD